MMPVDTYMKRSRQSYRRPRFLTWPSLGQTYKGTCRHCGTRGINSNQPCPFCHRRNHVS